MVVGRILLLRKRSVAQLLAYYAYVIVDVMLVIETGGPVPGNPPGELTDQLIGFSSVCLE